MELRKLEFSFDQDYSKTQSNALFKNFDLKIPKHEITCLLGPSGCGKSTLLRIYAGLLSPSLKNSPLMKEDLKESFVFQEPSLLEWKTGLENIMFPFELSRKVVKLNHYNKILAILKIKDVLELYPHQMSGGQKMRVAIARALMTEPEVLFMDEPFSALDEPTRHELQDELLQILSDMKMTVVFVTHSFYEAVYLANRIIILSNSKPSQIVFHQGMDRKFTSRFDEIYQSEVFKISENFKRAILK